MEHIDLTELEVVEETALSSVGPNVSGVFCGGACGGACGFICGVSCW